MEDKAKEWEVRLNLAQAGHYAASEKYMFINNILGVPLVVLSSFVSAFLFFDQPGAQEWINLALKISGLIVAILASLQTFMRPAEKAEMHRVKATKYGGLKRKIEQFLCQGASESDWPIFSKEVITEWNGIADDSPVTPQSLRKKVKSIITTDFKSIEQ